MIVIGLGNPGQEYAETRHNAGFMLLEAARRRWGDEPWKRRGDAEEGSLRLGARRHRLVRPLRFMNCSGEVVAGLVQRGAAPSDLLVVLDDIDLPLGRLRIRGEGGSGGHKGLQSIVEALATSAIARMRIGVGRPGADAVDHVLGTFSPEERTRWPLVLDRALSALELVLTRGLDVAMNRYNGLGAPWEEVPPAGTAAGCQQA